MSVFNVLNTAIYSKLTGGTALTSLLASGSAVYYLQAIDNATLPYIVFDHPGGGPQNINPSDMRSQLVQVRCYALSPALSGSIDAQASALLDRKTLSVTGYTNFVTVRETDVSSVEVPEDGTKIYMSGASYRVRLDS